MVKTLDESSSELGLKHNQNESTQLPKKSWNGAWIWQQPFWLRVRPKDGHALKAVNIRLLIYVPHD